MAIECSTCGAANFQACGCYDRCRCGHDRRSHTARGLCTHVGCPCLHGLHGSAGLGPDPTLALKMGVDRVGGGHGGEQ